MLSRKVIDHIKSSIFICCFISVSVSAANIANNYKEYAADCPGGDILRPELPQDLGQKHPELQYMEEYFAAINGVALAKCQQYCDDLASCGGVSYNAGNKRCALKKAMFSCRATISNGYVFYQKEIRERERETEESITAKQSSNKEQMDPEVLREKCAAIAKKYNFWGRLSSWIKGDLDGKSTFEKMAFLGSSPLDFLPLECAVQQINEGKLFLFTLDPEGYISECQKGSPEILENSYAFCTKGKSFATIECSDSERKKTTIHYHYNLNECNDFRMLMEDMKAAFESEEFKQYMDEYVDNMLNSKEAKKEIKRQLKQKSSKNK